MTQKNEQGSGSGSEKRRMSDGDGCTAPLWDRLWGTGTGAGTGRCAAASARANSFSSAHNGNNGAATFPLRSFSAGRDMPSPQGGACPVSEQQQHQQQQQRLTEAEMSPARSIALHQSSHRWHGSLPKGSAGSLGVHAPRLILVDPRISTHPPPPPPRPLSLSLPVMTSELLCSSTRTHRAVDHSYHHSSATTTATTTALLLP
jgi:hypothetical protein